MRMRLLAVAFVVLAVLGGGVARGTPGPNGHNNHGLCKAYFAGSPNGQEHKRKAPPFQNLEAAAEAEGETVQEFCDRTGTPGGK